MRTTTVTGIETARWIGEHESLPVVWNDPTIDTIGFDPRSPYVEIYWLAVLGPSSILAVRRMAEWLEDKPSGIEITLEDLAQSLGLGRSIGRNSPIVRTLQRLLMFGLAAIAWDTYALRRTIPPLSVSQQRHLPGYLAARHDDDLRRLVAEANLAPVVPLVR